MPLQDVIERIRKLKDPPNEEATKFAMVLPILRELGWDDADPGLVQPEYAVGKGKNKGKVDLALMASQKGPVAFVEVKAAGTPLEGHVEQLLRYAFNTSARVCALTSGMEWWLFLPRADGEPMERCFAVLTIGTDSVDQLIDDFQTYLGLGLLRGGKSKKRAEQVLAAKQDSERLNSELPRIWGDMLKAPPQELIELLEGRVFRSIRLRPSGEQVTQFLNAQAVVPTDVGTPPVTPPNGPIDPPPPPTGGRPAAFRLWGKEHPVKGWIDVWAGVAQAVHDHNPQRFGELVGKPRGKRSYVELDRRGMRRPQQIGQYWIEAHGSGKDMRDRSHYLLELAGYPDDLTYPT